MMGDANAHAVTPLLRKGDMPPPFHKGKSDSSHRPPGLSNSLWVPIAPPASSSSRASRERSPACLIMGHYGKYPLGPISPLLAFALPVKIQRQEMVIGPHGWQVVERSRMWRLPCGLLRGASVFN